MAEGSGHELASWARFMPQSKCAPAGFLFVLILLKKTWSNMDYNYDVGHDYNEEIQESGNDDLLDNHAPDAAID